jgi:hypothetical protein
MANNFLGFFSEKSNYLFTPSLCPLIITVHSASIRLMRSTDKWAPMGRPKAWMASGQHSMTEGM